MTFMSYECFEREITDYNGILFSKPALPFQLTRYLSAISKDEEMNQINKYLH